MQTNPQQNFGFEKKRPNEIAGAAEAYLYVVKNSLFLTSKSLLMDPKMRRLMEEENNNKTINPTPEVASSVARPTATEMLAQVATSHPADQVVQENANILASDPGDQEVMANDLREYIDTLHNGSEAPIVQPSPEPTSHNPGDYRRAA